MLMIQSKKQIISQKLVKLKIKFLIIIMINTLPLLKFNNLTTKNFAARLAKANLITKTDFDTKLINLNKNTTSNKQRICLFKIN